MAPGGNLHHWASPGSVAHGRRNLWLDTQPQWERSHDQKNGIRIGESKTPAQTTKQPGHLKKWTAVTANITAW
eukprot:13558629-Heterocapsa_arctica.AAC.1